jgi:hypothetical protein
LAFLVYILIGFNVSLIGSSLAISLSNVRTKEGAVENVIGFLGVGSAIGISFLLALGLEWLSLRALMQLMPGRAEMRPSAQPELAAPAKQTSRWASLGYPRDVAERQIGVRLEKRMPAPRERRGAVARDLLTASGRVRLNRVVLP